MNKKEQMRQIVVDAKNQKQQQNKLKADIRVARNTEPRPVGGSIARDRFITEWNKPVMENINIPRTPLTCTGSSFQCRIAGSGKTPIRNVSMYPEAYDMLGTDIKEGGMLGKTYRLPVLHNWHNTSNATKFTKESMRNTYGFENFQ